MPAVRSTRRTARSIAAVAALAIGGIAATAVPASAQKVKPKPAAEKKSCTMGGKTYKHRAVVIGSGGNYECNDGRWVVLTLK